jgi:hypothetical protein
MQKGKASLTRFSSDQYSLARFIFGNLLKRCRIGPVVLSFSDNHHLLLRENKKPDQMIALYDRSE